LEERGLYRAGMLLNCKPDEQLTDEEQILYASPNCCGKHLLEAQPDFKAQRTAIQEVVEDSGHIFELYPKFHCECNFIERFWGTAKRRARVECDYKFMGLLSRVPMILDSIPIAMIRKFARKSWRYIDAYALGYKGLDAQAVVKTYKSHRRIGMND